jgi:predicted amidohydrolase
MPARRRNDVTPTTRITRVAAAQLGPASDDAGETVDRIVGLIRAGAEANVELIAFPELALTPYFCFEVHDNLDAYVETDIPSPRMARVIEAAASHRIAIVLPFAERDSDGRTYNSALTLDVDGEVRGHYQKVHVPGKLEPAATGTTCLERRYFEPGSRGLPVADTAVGKVGTIICYDRSFPEAWRLLGVRGADIVVTPHNTCEHVPHNRDSGRSAVEELRWQKHVQMTAAAISNGYFVIAPGKAGVELGTEYIGNSCVISPHGATIASAHTDGDELVVAELAVATVAAMREQSQHFERRRPECYGELTDPAGA